MAAPKHAIVNLSEAIGLKKTATRVVCIDHKSLTLTASCPSGFVSNSGSGSKTLRLRQTILLLFFEG
jgi:hypothetical protein